MAASESQKMKARLLLETPLSAIEPELDALSVTELAELDSILAEAEKLKFRAAKVNINGVEVDPTEARKLLIDRLWSLLGFNDDSGGFVLGRG